MHIIKRLTPKIGLLSTCPRETPLLSVDVDKTAKIGVIRLCINALACPLGVDKRGHLWTLDLRQQPMKQQGGGRTAYSMPSLR